MGSVARFERRDWWIGAILFALSFLLRMPLRSQFAFYWDSAQFALALDHYDLASGLPHPPGYFLYVMFGRLMDAPFHDPHATLVWIGVVFGSLLPAMLYLLGAAAFSRSTGICAAVIGASSPLTWFYSLIVYTYVVDAVLAAVFVLLCWRARQHGVPWTYVIALSVCYALILGVRQQSGMTLAPLVLYTLWGSRQQRLQKSAGAFVLIGAVVLMWAVPLLSTTGGLENYLNIVNTHWQSNRSRTAGDTLLTTILLNVFMMIGSSVLGLLPVALGLIIVVIWRRRELVAFMTAPARSRFFLVWLGPAFVFWSLTFTHLPGHVITYFCGLTILAGAMIAAIGNRALIAGVLVFVVAGNAWLFATRPAIVSGLVGHSPLTYREIHTNDRRMGMITELVRRRFANDDVVLCHVGEFFVEGFRQYQYHLPNYTNVMLTPDPSLPGENGRKLWLGRNRETLFVDAVPYTEMSSLLLVVPVDGTLDMFDRYVETSAAKLVEGSEGMLYEAPVAALRKRPAE